MNILATTEGNVAGTEHYIQLCAEKCENLEVLCLAQLDDACGADNIFLAESFIGSHINDKASKSHVQRACMEDKVSPYR